MKSKLDPVRVPRQAALTALNRLRPLREVLMWGAYEGIDSLERFALACYLQGMQDFLLVKKATWRP